MYFCLLLTAPEPCKTQLLTNLMPQNGSKHFLKQELTSLMITQRWQQGAWFICQRDHVSQRLEGTSQRGTLR